MRIKLIKNLFIIFLLFFYTPLVIYAHGIKYNILNEKIIGIQVLTESDEPLSMAKVVITGPGGKEKKLETFTDKNGIFYFHPKHKGDWKIKILDNTGHGLVMNWFVDDSMNISDLSDQRTGRSWSKIFMAICVLWGFAGTAFSFYRKKQK